MKQKQAQIGYLLIFMTGIGWGTSGYFVTQMAKMGASSFLTGFTGHFFAIFPLLLVILLTRGLAGLKISRRGLVFTLIMGIITKAFFKLAYDTTIAMIGVSSSAVLLYTAPVWVAMMSSVFFKERLRASHYLALVMNLVGVFLMVTLGDISSLNVASLGILFGLTAAWLHALNTVLAKVATSGDDPLTTTFYMLAVSAAVLALVAQPWKAENMVFLTNRTFLFWALANAFITGALSNLLYLMGLATPIDASKAPVISSVEVIVASLLGVALFNEPMNWIGVLGIALMLVSIVVINQAPDTDNQAEYQTL